ncbi:MAG: FAD-binding protein [Deltaproteobacteria bacterium]|nr:FAD-binding protein [Deltaproteobacteria bacterium]MBW2154932.1 FAD-binding protein [Deltaproteobacteria bacterium]
MGFINNSVQTINTEVLIIGGGGAGCMAAIWAKKNSDASVIIVENGWVSRKYQLLI